MTDITEQTSRVASASSSTSSSDDIGGISAYPFDPREFSDEDWICMENKISLFYTYYLGHYVGRRIKIDYPPINPDALTDWKEWCKHKYCNKLGFPLCPELLGILRDMGFRSRDIISIIHCIYYRRDMEIYGSDENIDIMVAIMVEIMSERDQVIDREDLAFIGYKHPHSTEVDSALFLELLNELE